MERLARLLESAGHEAIFDTESLRSGEDFPSQLAEAIEDADELILVLSPESATSDWVHREISLAVDIHKPLRVIERKPNVDLPARLRLLVGSIQRATVEDIRHPLAPKAISAALDGDVVAAVPIYRLPRLAIAGVAVAAISILGGVMWNLWPRPEKWAMQNIEFVVDSSQHSTADFEDLNGPTVSKLEAIEAALNDKVSRETASSMALRSYGTIDGAPCSETDLQIGFRRNNGTDILDRVGKFEAGGAASLYLAVQNALEDLQVPVEELPSEYATRKVIVFATAPDDCDAIEAVLEQQIDELASTGVKLELRLVGLRFDADEVANLRTTFDRVCNDTCNSQVLSAANTDELLAILNEWVRVEPVIDLALAIDDINRAATEASSRAVEAANRRDADTFDTQLSITQDLLADAQVSFRDVSDRVSSENSDGQYDEVAELASETQSAFSDWIAKLDDARGTVLDLADNPDDSDLIDEWNLKVDAANDAVRVLDDVNEQFGMRLVDLVEELRSDV